MKEILEHNKKVSEELDELECQIGALKIELEGIEKKSDDTKETLKPPCEFCAWEHECGTVKKDVCKDECYDLFVEKVDDEEKEDEEPQNSVQVLTDEEVEKENEFGKTCSEVQLYFKIDAYGSFMWRMNHDMGHGRIPEKDHAVVSKDVMRIGCLQNIVVKYTERFGVPFRIEEADGLFGKYQKACDEYMQWYRHWDNWKNNLSDQEWNTLERLGMQIHKNPEGAETEALQAEYDSMLPKKRWNES